MRHCQIPTLLILLAISASGTVYKYQPSSPLRIGGGFDAGQPQAVHLNCIEYDGLSHLEGGEKATVRTDFNITVIHDRKQLYQQLNVDANLSARSTFASGSASFSLDERYSFDSNDLMWTLRASTDYGRWALNSPRISKQAQKLSDEDFAERCGTEFVFQERRIA